MGEPVTAVAAGTVSEAGSYVGYGFAVLVAHDTTAGTYNSLYSHLQSISVTRGQRVSAGQEVGKLGRSGNANGIVHLHFALRKGGAISADGGATTRSQTRASIVMSLDAPGGPAVHLAGGPPHRAPYLGYAGPRSAGTTPRRARPAKKKKRTAAPGADREDQGSGAARSAR